MTSFEAADRRFLLKAASVIRSGLRFRSPSEPIAASWELSTAAPTVRVTSRRITTFMTETNAYHPLFGNRHKWYAENVHEPLRTGWTGRAVQEVIDRAAEDGLDEWLRGIAITSKYFTYLG